MGNVLHGSRGAFFFKDLCYNVDCGVHVHGAEMPFTEVNILFSCPA